MRSFEIPLPKVGLDLGRTLTSGQVFRWHQLPDGAWAGTDDDCVWIIKADSERLKVQSTHHPDRLIHFLGLDRDREADFQRILASEPTWTARVAHRKNVALLRCQNPAEVLLSFLCTANNHLSRIVPMVHYLASRGDLILSYQGWEARKFPTLHQIAQVTEAELRSAGFGYRSATIPLVAKAVLDQGGEEWFHSLRGKPYEEASESLIQFRSVGRKLADCICLYGLHFGESVPVDTHLWQAATTLYFPEWQGKALTETRYKAVGNLMRSKFGCLAGLAHHLLFFENLEKRRK